jgi:hypothetical protein
MEHGVKFRTRNFKSFCRSGLMKRLVRKFTYYNLYLYTSSVPLNFSDRDHATSRQSPALLTFLYLQLLTENCDMHITAVFWAGLWHHEKETVGFIMSVHPCETTQLPMDGILLDWYMRNVRKSVKKIQFLLKSDKNTG